MTPTSGILSAKTLYLVHQLSRFLNRFPLSCEILDKNTPEFQWNPRTVGEYSVRNIFGDQKVSQPFSSKKHLLTSIFFIGLENAASVRNTARETRVRLASWCQKMSDFSLAIFICGTITNFCLRKHGGNSQKCWH